MKKIIDKKTILTIIISGIFFSCVSGYAATIILSKDVVYNNKTSEAEAVNVQDAVDELYEIAKLGKCPTCEFDVGKTWTFDYTGGEQEFNVPCNGTYKLETWGAQGGDFSGYIGGYGAYSVGLILGSQNQKVYLNVGGKPINTVAGGYNGGGNVTGLDYGIGGGGATSMASTSGVISSITNKENLYIISGGGGGANKRGAGYGDGNGGHGGGLIGCNGQTVNHTNGYGYGFGTGGTQTSGGYFDWLCGTGVPASGKYTDSIYVYTPTAATYGHGGEKYQSGGGGGYYGGGWSAHGGAGGGSGYIGNPSLTNKAMYCYDCQTSNDVNTKTISNTCVNATPTEKCSKTGNGYAKITLVSLK